VSAFFSVLCRCYAVKELLGNFGLILH
jgi:hypothetical protein